MMLLVSIAGCAEDVAPPTEQPGPESATPPGSYTFRLDSERSDPGQFRLSEADGSVRILTGPAGIAFKSGDQVLSGDFRVEATFVQFGAPVGYREAYGIFVGAATWRAPTRNTRICWSGPRATT